MKRQSLILQLAVCAAFGALFHCSSRKPDARMILRVEALRCENLVNPEGIDAADPRLTWSFRSEGRGLVQAAYRVLAAGSREALKAEKGDLWDSGKILSGRSVDIRYGGRRLRPGEACHWKVQVWDGDGNPSAWSEPGFWRAGKTGTASWKAEWIGLERAVGKDDPKSPLTRCSARMLRKEFEVARKVKNAVVFYSGLGLSELYLNGVRVGDEVLSPGLTEYEKRVFYITHDVTSLIREGANAAGVLLGNGRYFAPRRDEHVSTMRFPKLIFELRIEFQDGTVREIVSDGTWKLSADGPITANNEYDGEVYDARKEIRGWDLPGFDDSRWMKAGLVEGPAGKLEAQPIAPIRVTQTVKPAALTQPKPHLTVVDMGQNMVGWVRLRVKGGKPGTAVRLRFAETLQKDGMLYTANLRSARAEDVFILKGDTVETFEPRFTYHGFRYVEVTGYPGAPDPGAIEGRVIHDALESAGTFTCSNSMINRIYGNVVWGVRGNYRSMPTDCPQRDERQGWLGDRAIGSKGESFLFNIHALYRKWMNDIRDSQTEAGSIPDVVPTYWKIYNDNTTWAGTYVILADMLCTQYGDSGVVREHYPSMKKWMGYMTRYLKDGLMMKDTYGDWCVPPESPLLIHSRDPKRTTPPELIGTAYFYHEARLMEKFARMLALPGDVKAFGDMADGLKAAMNGKLFDRNAVQYANHSATSNLLPLAFDMVPDTARQRIFGNIVEKIMGDADGHTVVGLVGAQWIMRMLSRYGRPDVAAMLATNDTYPSWGYMVRNGATTIWELWNGNTADPAMNSGNHVMLVGDLVIWLFENLGGIQSDPLQPGFKRILMKPEPCGDVTFANATVRSAYGLIRSEWGIQSGRFLWNVEIPPNSGATLFIPAADEKSVRERGKPARKSKGLRFLRMEDGRAVYAAGSGLYAFSVDAYRPPPAPKPFAAAPLILPPDTTVVLPSKVPIRMHCRTEGAQIRYTLDGSEPTERSPIYEQPFETDKTVVITARAFKPGMSPSYIRTSIIDVADPRINGLKYAYYEGKWNALPDFTQLRPRKTGSVLGFDFSKIKMRQDYFGVVFTGFFQVPSDGEYGFALSSDDGSRLALDGRTVVINDSIHAMTEKSGVVRLTGGRHAIRIEFFDGLNTDALTVSVQGPGLPRQPLPASSLFMR
jgi:alpha-L-rhamnosidase